MQASVDVVSQLLADDLAPQTFVFEVVRWLDLRIADDREGVERELLVRAFAATGPLLPRIRTVERTLEAAEAFVAAPTAERYSALQSAATDSYPFGPGDGCYAVEGLGYIGCEPGSGCSSGAGCLRSIAELAGYERTSEALRGALRSWLDRLV